MRDFGRRLPIIRKRVDEDLRKPGLQKRKVLAAVVYLLEHSLIRIGNEEYARENNSFGLTTLRNRHVAVSGSSITFSFLGKSQVRHKVELHDVRLARVIKKLQDLPGQELFQYLDDDDHPVSVASEDVNAYLQEISRDNFTAKDFRTWHGTVLALTELANVEAPLSKAERKRALTLAVKSVAKRLGNTPAVCRRCYIHPVILDAFLKSKLSATEDGDDAEAALLRLLAKSPSR